MDITPGSTNYAIQEQLLFKKISKLNPNWKNLPFPTPTKPTANHTLKPEYKRTNSFQLEKSRNLQNPTRFVKSECKLPLQSSLKKRKRSITYVTPMKTVRFSPWVSNNKLSPFKHPTHRKLFDDNYTDNDKENKHISNKNQHKTKSKLSPLAVPVCDSKQYILNKEIEILLKRQKHLVEEMVQLNIELSQKWSENANIHNNATIIKTDTEFTVPLVKKMSQLKVDVINNAGAKYLVPDTPRTQKKMAKAIDFYNAMRGQSLDSPQTNTSAFKRQNAVEDKKALSLKIQQQCFDLMDS